MHYQIHLTNIKLPMLVDADSMENTSDLLVLYKANTAVAGISLSELQCVIEVEASSVPPKEVFLEMQSELTTLRAKYQAKGIEIGKAIDQKYKLIDEKHELQEKLKKEEKSHFWTRCYLTIVCVVEVVLWISRSLH